MTMNEPAAAFLEKHSSKLNDYFAIHRENIVYFGTYKVKDSLATS